MKRRYLVFTGMALALAACAPTAPVEVIVERPTLPPADPVAVGPIPDPAAPPGTTTGSATDTILITQRSGLVERLPNTCKLELYQQFQGQPESVLPAAGIDRVWRVVRPDAIVTQEYNPSRLNFYVNGAGVVQRIACG